MLAELILPALNIVLMLLWFSWHVGMCQPKCTAGLTIRFLGAPSKWMSVQHQGPDFAPRISQLERNWRPYGSFKQLFFAWTAMWNNNQIFSFGFASPLRLSRATCCPQDFCGLAQVHMLQSISSDWIGVVHALWLRCFALLSLWALQIFLKL